MEYKYVTNVVIIKLLYLYRSNMPLFTPQLLLCSHLLTYRLPAINIADQYFKSLY